ncbi:VWA domain-containing protein [Telmatobacter sp. DSM 110680]|uniref:VWA domain-containing protein n=1 Tax=Telmatobacter sp. DSM 110680 TaxID=3036704 RepID=A0AAU7DK71_9BACT
MSNGFDLSLTAARPALLADRDNTVDVLIRVQAPDAPKSGLPDRPRLNLAIVIDRSGSMQGEPLHEAKRAAGFIIDSLKATDRASVVSYDDTVRVVAESRHVENKAYFKNAVSQIQSGGSTNLHGGWLKGAEEAAGHLDPECNSRVLLLSDGQANHGETNVDEIATQCAKLADNGVTTSTYGLGHSFNEELMVAMARSGRGNNYYSEAAESLLERFHEEFSLLSSLCARNVRLLLTPLPGIRCEMLNLYEAGKDGSWRLPDLVYDGEAWAAVRLHIDAKSLPVVGEMLALLQASVVYLDLDGAECQIPETWLTLPVLTEEKFHATPKNGDVIRRATEAEAAQLQEFASKAAKRRDWGQVNRLLATAREMAAHSPWLAEIVANLETLAAQQNDVLFSKEAQYGARSMGSRLRSKTEFAANFADSAVPSYLQRKVRQGASGHYGQPLEGEKYQLELFDNYPVALIDGKRVLLDTGSPFSVGNGDRFEIAGQPFRFQGQLGVTTDKLSQWMNTQIDALLGTDVLSKFVVALDWWNSTVTFSPQGSKLLGEDLPVEQLMGTPVLKLRTTAGKCKALFDTGAKLCYMPRSAVADLFPVNHVRDFHVMGGPFETDVYEVDVKIAQHSFIANCGVLPEALASLVGKATGIEWVIGTDLLRQGAIGLDLRHNHVTASWQPAGTP